MKLGKLLEEQVWGENQEFCLEHGGFEMSTFYVQVEMSRRQVDLQVLSLTEKSDLEIYISRFFSALVTFFRAMRLAIAQEACVTREGGKAWVPSSGL